MGAMGAGIYRYFTEYGARLVGFSDLLFGGTWVFRDILPDELRRALIAREFDTAIRLLPKIGVKISEDPADILYQEAEVLFPAATEDVITVSNAHQIKAPYIIEGANNPTTQRAYRLLFADKKLVVPDIIANPGGIIAAFTEIALPTTIEGVETRAKVTEAKRLTIDKIRNNTLRLVEMVNTLGVRPDQAGFVMACRNIKYGLPNPAPA
jgi:glutamate dehydrogenase (NAD(P)+)